MENAPIFKRKKKFFNSVSIDYKDVRSLSRFVTERHKIIPARRTGLDAKAQRALRLAIKRARQLALLPYCTHHKGAIIS